MATIHIKDKIDICFLFTVIKFFTSMYNKKIPHIEFESISDKIL